MEFLKELFQYFKKRKKWFLFPTFLFLFILGFLIFYAGGTAVAPFIYTVF